MNSQFSFSWTSCLTKAEEPSLSYYLPIAGGRIIGFIPFPRALVLCEMQSSRPGFELESPCPFPRTITITPRTPPSPVYKPQRNRHPLPIIQWSDLGGLQNTPTASLQRSKNSPNERPRYDTKQSDSEAPVILELWGMQSTPSLSSLPEW